MDYVTNRNLVVPMSETRRHTAKTAGTVGRIFDDAVSEARFRSLLVITGVTPMVLHPAQRSRAGIELVSGGLWS